MAELGDFVDQGPKSRGEVTLEMMDYKFVDECTVRHQSFKCPLNTQHVCALALVVPGASSG